MTGELQHIQRCLDFESLDEGLPVAKNGDSADREPYLTRVEEVSQKTSEHHVERDPDGGLNDAMSDQHTTLRPFPRAAR